jgi:hypothetical protein
LIVIMTGSLEPGWLAATAIPGWLTRQARGYPAIVRAVPESDWSLSACTRHPHPDWWTDRRPSLREAARHVCAGCQILAQCAAWALTLPVIETAIYGGMSPAERRRRQRAEREREAALIEARRGYGRRSEARRRQLGKAETPEQQRERYQRNPEPQRPRRPVLRARA